MPSPSMKLHVAVDLLKNANDALMSDRNTGFSDVLTTAIIMCSKINMDAKLKQQRLKTTKRHF